MKKETKIKKVIELSKKSPKPRGTSKDCYRTACPSMKNGKCENETKNGCIYRQKGKPTIKKIKE